MHLGLGSLARSCCPLRLQAPALCLVLWPVCTATLWAAVAYGAAATAALEPVRGTAAGGCADAWRAGGGGQWSVGLLRWCGICCSLPCLRPIRCLPLAFGLVALITATGGRKAQAVGTTQDRRLAFHLPDRLPGCKQADCRNRVRLGWCIQ